MSNKIKNKFDNKNESIKKIYGEKKDKINNIEYLNNKSNYKTKLENTEETKKYIIEMQEMEDRNEKKTNIFATIVISVVLLTVSVFTIKLLFLKPKDAMYDSNKQINNSIQIEKDENHNNTDNNGENTESTNGTNPSDENSQKNTSSNDSSVDNTNSKENIGSNFNKKLYKYMLDDNNRQKSLDSAIALNKGNTSGVNIYYLSQLMRNSGLDIPESTCNTAQLVGSLKNNGWKADYDYTKLQKGDICFTTEQPGMTGIPSHAYIFMGWVEEGKTDYAYICDGQIKQYNKTIHTRNIDFPTETKEKFHFFMRK
jgi:hypothetical protein